MSLEEREIYINACILMEAELNGVPLEFVDRWHLAAMDDEALIKEHDWLYELVYLK